MKINKIIWAVLILVVYPKFSFGQDIAADTVLANSYFEKAIVFQENSTNDSAIIYFERAGKLFENNQLWNRYLDVNAKIAICYQNQRMYNSAIQCMKSAIKLYLNNKNKEDAIVAYTYYVIGMQYYYISQYDSTMIYWKKSLDLRKKIFPEKHLAVAASYNNMGMVNNVIGEYNKALEFYKKSLDIKIDLLSENNNSVANNYNNIASAYWNKNEYNLSAQYFLKALRIRKDLFGEDHLMVGESYVNLGSLYNDKLDYKTAKQYYLKGLEIFKNHLDENNSHMSTIYNNLGVVYCNLKDFEQAIKYQNKALEIDKNIFGENHYYVAIDYINIGRIYEGEGKYNLALGAYKKSLGIKRSLLGEKNASVALTYYYIGNLYEQLDQYDNALQYYQKVLVSSIRNYNDSLHIDNIPGIKEYLNWRTLLTALVAKGNILANANCSYYNLELSKQHFQTCDTLVDIVRHSLISKSDKLDIVEYTSNLYNSAINVCKKLMEQGDNDKIQNYKELTFYFSEKNKSSVLLEALAGAEAQKFAGIPDSLLEIENNLSSDIAQYKKLLAEQSDSVQEIKFRDKLFTANRQYDELIKTFEENYPKYFELKYNQKPASVRDIQNLLDDKTAMISYFTGDSSTTIFTITQDDLDIKSVPTTENLADKVKYYRYGLIYTSSSRFAEIYKKQAYQFYKNLIPENIDNDIKNLIIIPDAELSMIPFETFLTEEAGEKEWKELSYLIKIYNVSYSYSANLFYKTFPKEPASKIETTDLNDWLAFAPVFDDSGTAGLTLRTRELLGKFNSEMDDTLGTRGRLIDGGYISPLPGTESEVKAIFKEFDDKGKKAKVQIKNSANEEFIKSGDLSKYKFLHFATHGFANTEKPELSGIFLAQDSTSNEDGILYQGEIYNLDLNADLTVLSASETGLGQSKKGEALIGLTRALLYAGSKNIIVSLWSVADESTSDLMINFYKNLLEENQQKMEFSKALRQSKLAMIDQGKFAHPFYWSPFILIGK